LQRGGKRSATPLWDSQLQKNKEIQSTTVVGVLQIWRFQIQQEFFSSLLEEKRCIAYTPWLSVCS
jgi:hypothetical protein